MKLITFYLKKHWAIFCISTLFLTVEAAADLLQPLFMSLIVDNGVENADLDRILSYGFIMLGIALAGALSAIMRNIFSSWTSQTVGKEIRRDMFRNVQHLSLENIDRLQPASIVTRMTNDVTQVQEFINGLMRMIVKAPITCLGAFALIFIQTPRLIPIMIVIIGIVVCLFFGNIKAGYPRFARLQVCMDKMNGVIREFLASVRVVKAFRAEDEETEKFDESAEQLSKANTSALQALAIFSPLINLTINLGIVLLLWISQNSDSAEIGKLMASVNYMTQILFSLSMISNAINTAVRAMASARRIQEVLSETPAQRVSENLLKPDIKGNITFQNVTFTYAGGGNPALENIQLNISAGETIGIIGPTGAGKSTLINLLPRFYDASAGSVLIDGFDVTQIEEHWLREAIAVVPQRSLLFTGTISENLHWGREDASEEEIALAARIACADGFILESEHQYDTMIGQGGVNLSGGQKQRLSLARAIVRKPKILILDDCTSALDAETEAAVMNGLQESMDQTTMLLISQRVTTVMKTDRIICMENGRVCGFGSHQDLLDTCPTYQKIFYSQMGGDSSGG